MAAINNGIKIHFLKKIVAASNDIVLSKPFFKITISFSEIHLYSFTLSSSNCKKKYHEK